MPRSEMKVALVRHTLNPEEVGLAANQPEPASGAACRLDGSGC